MQTVRMAPLCPQWPSEILSAVHRLNRDCSTVPKAQPCTLPRGKLLTHNLILCNLGVVSGKRTSDKCSKPESQENPTDFQCVWCCVATQQLEKKYTADLGTSYINSLKMPFNVHVKHEAKCFLLQQSSSKWGISEDVGTLKCIRSHLRHPFLSIWQRGPKRLPSNWGHWL